MFPIKNVIHSNTEEDDRRGDINGGNLKLKYHNKAPKTGVLKNDLKHFEK